MYLNRNGEYYRSYQKRRRHLYIAHSRASYLPPKTYPMPHPPRLIIIGGANGSGKTTLAKPYTAAIELPFLNADELTTQLEAAVLCSLATL